MGGVGTGLVGRVEVVLAGVGGPSSLPFPCPQRSSVSFFPQRSYSINVGPNAHPFLITSTSFIVL